MTSKTETGTSSSTSASYVDDDGDSPKRELVVMGQDLGSIPCFRNSFLYGITGGFASGIASFAFTSSVPKATKIGFYSYVGITLVYWFYCRYDYSVTKFEYTRTQHALKMQVAYEGTSQDPTSESHTSKSKKP